MFEELCQVGKSIRSAVVGAPGGGCTLQLICRKFTIKCGSYQRFDDLLSCYCFSSLGRLDKK